MKRIAALVLMSSLSSAVMAMPGTTNDGYAACLEKQWLDDIVNFSLSKDKASFKAYMEMKRCVVIKGGLRVTVTDGPGMFGGTTEFVYNGVRFWAPREAIKYGE